MGTTITIQGELTDLNSYIAAMNSHRYAGNNIKKQETERIAWQVKRHRNHNLSYPVFIEFKWICKDRRKDKDNIAFAKKFILDGLVEAGVLPNDGWKHVAGWKDIFLVDKENPRIEIKLKEV